MKWTLHCRSTLMTYLPSIRAGIPQAVITHREIYLKIDFRIQSDLCVTQRPKADARFGINNELHQRFFDSNIIHSLTSITLSTRQSWQIDFIFIDLLDGFIHFWICILNSLLRIFRSSIGSLVIDEYIISFGA